MKTIKINEKEATFLSTLLLLHSEELTVEGKALFNRLFEFSSSCFMKTVLDDLSVVVKNLGD